MLRREFRPIPMALVTVAALQAAAVGAQTLTDGQDAQALAREVTVLRTELRQQQDLVLLLRHRLAESEASSAWLPWLLLAFLAVLALAAWLGFRGRRSRGAGASSRSRGQRARGGEPGELGPASGFARSGGDDVAGPATVFAPGAIGLVQQESSSQATQISTHGLATQSTTPVLASRLEPASGPGVGLAPPFSADEPAFPAVGAEAPKPESLAALAAKQAAPSDPEAVSARGALAPLPAAPVAAAPMEPPVRPVETTVAGPAVRAMSVDELFDLDQQVDFFLALGQAESAVDLLVSHIRGTGGNSALPYLKLMEVYRQQSDADSYERTRKRFNQRFNAHAPDWSGHPDAGRHLEEYPEVLDRLHRVWANPLDALAELEALLFRRSRGELFDLPAFRDVLLLHGIAVDLHERSPMSASKVDILLPLTEVPPPALGAPSAVPVAVPGPAAAPALASAPTARGLLAGWAGLGMGPEAEAAAQNGALAAGGTPGKPKSEAFSLDLDLSDFAPAPREYTHPAAFTDLDLRGPFSVAQANGPMGDGLPKPSAS